ncbi:YihY/virulence factor BrkB family protein [Citricoccus sp. SGAir0253]|uniref:YihY/virulence factor BrkB family protein n=1 Tax=Citricoccus sp. SGAir0253 TaxID=2567881 RepID=UPI0010CCE380|nr:YihY/virulence factor BrkB family protein [Citricoccus sp. SGAir0253]QCU77316.1 YihY/virulence factor BrkB family protein [Citricoccus sp. SGAir0253]
MPRLPSRRPAAVRTLDRPRVTLFHVIRRTVMKLVDLQVWDVAASMTFFSLLSLVPAAISVVSIVSLLGLEEETVRTGAELVHELLPGVDPEVASATLLALSETSGGVLGVVLGLVGSIVAASNVMASVHRAMHRIHDTREGRRFLWFRTVVFLETLVLMIAMIALLLLVLVGGGLSERLGDVLGLPTTTVAAWNLLKWPVILAVIVVAVTAAYHRGPNVVQPPFRWLSWGGLAAVLVLFGMTVLLGWLADRFGTFDQVLGTLNGLVVVMVLLWIGYIVLVAGAAFDAELLRGRQLAAGLPAWDVLQLRTRYTGVLEFLDEDAARARSTARAVAESARTGEPVTVPRSPWIAEAGTLWAIDAVDRPVSTGAPHAPRDPGAAQGP